MLQCADFVFQTFLYVHAFCSFDIKYLIYQIYRYISIRNVFIMYKIQYNIIKMLMQIRFIKCITLKKKIIILQLYN